MGSYALSAMFMVASYLFLLKSACGLRPNLPTRHCPGGTSPAPRYHSQRHTIVHLSIFGCTVSEQHTATVPGLHTSKGVIFPLLMSSRRAAPFLDRSLTNGRSPR